MVDFAQIYQAFSPYVAIPAVDGNKNPTRDAVRPFKVESEEMQFPPVIVSQHLP